jgi:hypothetical protein
VVAELLQRTDVRQDVRLLPLEYVPNLFAAQQVLVHGLLHARQAAAYHLA